MDYLSILIGILFVVPLLKGLFRRYSPDDFKNELILTVKLIIFVISLLAGFYTCKRIILYNNFNFFTEYIYKYIGNSANIFKEKPIIIYLVSAPLLAFLIYFIFFKIVNIILGKILYPILDCAERGFSGRGKIIQGLFGLILSVPKAVIYPCLLCGSIYFYTITWSNSMIDKIIFQSKIHNEISRRVIVPVMSNSVINNIPKLVKESLKIDIEEVENVFTNNITIYYNGVTLEDGIAGNMKIKETTEEICKDAIDDRERSYFIYRWVVENIVYDDDKAIQILNDEYEEDSGAIVAFKYRKGVCFDYACLVSSMLNYQNIPNRIITGKGFNGHEWINHSWNEIYVDDQWINVDATFGLSSNYFDNFTFDLDHKDRKVIGEWGVEEI